MLAYFFLVFTVFALVVAIPRWPWSRGWGWAPFGIVAVILATILLFGFVGGVWSP